MRFKDWLKVGTAGILSVLGYDTNANIPPPHNNGGQVQSVNFALKVPQLSDLEKKVASFCSEEGDKKELLAQGEYGDQFHTYFLLFIANSTLGVSHNFGDAFIENKPIGRGVIEKLNYSASFIGNNRTEDLYEILKKAEKEGHLDAVAHVMGYLDRASVRTKSIFSAFNFFYGTDSNTDSAQKILGRYEDNITEIREMTGRARTAFGSLSKEIRSELTRWVGTYGHASLQKALADVPAAPLLEKDVFYQRFGEDLLRGYGLLKQA